MKIDVSFSRAFYGAISVCTTDDSCSAAGDGGDTLSLLVSLNKCGTQAREGHYAVEFFNTLYISKTSSPLDYWPEFMLTCQLPKQQQQHTRIQISPPQLPEVFLKVVRASDTYGASAQTTSGRKRAVVILTLLDNRVYDMRPFGCRMFDSTRTWSLALHDNRGCPVDTRRVWLFEKWVNQPSARQSTFMATVLVPPGFDDIGHVIVDCSVQFCAGACPTPKCDVGGGWTSGQPSS